MPWVIRCGVCNHVIIADRKNGYLQACLHFQNSHSKNFNGLVFDNSHEYVSEEYHKKRREVIFHVFRISKKQYEFYKSLPRKQFRKLFTQQTRSIKQMLGDSFTAPSSVSIF